MKVWRGNGKEFPAISSWTCAGVYTARIPGEEFSHACMVALGFELVEVDEPSADRDPFEGLCRHLLAPFDGKRIRIVIEEVRK